VGSSDESSYGWLRCFSWLEITNSAYYGDTIGDAVNRKFDTLEHAGAWDHDIVITKVNPAYVIPFSVTAPAALPLFAQSPYPAEGGIAAGEGNNVLPHGILTVLWHNVSLGLSGYGFVAADGTWSADVIISNQTDIASFTNEIQFVAMAQSARPGLPVSEIVTRYIIGVPEPSCIAVLLLALCAQRRWRRGRRECVAHHPSRSSR
jgi:hypothetical protein